MRIEKKHKIYAGLIGTALAAWAVDAMFLRPDDAGPRRAAAATAPTQQENAPIVAAPAQRSGDELSASSKWLADRLTVWSRQKASDSESHRDVFSAPQSWSRQLAVPATQPVNTSAIVFQREHHIAAVIVNSRGGSILIDGRLVHVGQSVAGCRLVAVAQGRADFVAPDGQNFRMTVATEQSMPDR